jgi:DNA-binding transcriptional regulator YhcF (GntR family)
LISVKVNKEDGTDLLYLQVAAQIRRAIADGEAKPGERLPPARDLATVLGVNTNTVLRSLRLLQDEGLLELRRRAGSRSPGHLSAAPSCRKCASWSSSLAARDTPSTSSSR